jgi:hypothetical protein
MERVNCEDLWEDLAKYILVNMTGGWFGDRTKGDKKTVDIFDSLPGQANHDLASAMHSTITNPATQWVKYRFDTMELNNDDEALAWLDQASEAVMSALNESNWNTEVAKAYKFYTALGTMVIFHDEEVDSKGNWQGFRFKVWSLADCAWSENASGRVDTVARRFRLTARQAVEKWGDKVCDKIQASLERSPEDEFEFVQFICPRKYAEVVPGKRAKPTERPYACYYVCKSSNDIVEETGYYEFPVYVCRWETAPNEVYGRGPGHIALPDIKSLNQVKKLTLRATAKAIDPPLLVNQLSVLGNFDLRPGHISVVRDINGVKEMVPQARYDVTQMSVEQLHNSINRCFFIDKLMLPDREKIGEMSALEVSQRVQQMQRVLGPTLGRVDAELLNPLVARAFQMLLREGVLPPLTNNMQAMAERKGSLGIKVEYMNSMSRSQKIEELQAMQQWIQGLAVLAQLGKPEVLDIVQGDMLAELSARILGVPESAIATDKEVKQIRQARAKQQEQQAMMQQGLAAADMASKFAKSGGGGQGGGMV